MAFANLFLSGEKKVLTPENLQEILEILESRGIQARFFSELSFKKESKKNNTNPLKIKLNSKKLKNQIFIKKEKTLKELMSEAEFMDVAGVDKQFQILEENDLM
jgi:hypothetical protein